MNKIQYFAGFVYLVPYTFRWQHLGGYYVQDPIFFLALCIWSPIPLDDSIWEATMYKIQYFAGFVYLVPQTFVWQHLGGYYVQDPIFCWLCVFGPLYLCVTASGRLLCTRSNILLALYIWSPIPLCDSIWEATMYKIQYFAGFVYLVPHTFGWQHLGGYYVQDPIFCWLCVFGPLYLCVTASGRLLCTRSNILLALYIWSPIPLGDSIWEATMYKIQYFAGFVYLVPYTFRWQHLGGYYVQDPIFFWLCVFGPLYLCVTASGRLLCTRSNIFLALCIWSPIPLCDSIWEATMYKIQYFAGFVYLVPYTFVWQHLGGYYVQDPIFCWLCIFGPPYLCVTASGRLLCTRSNILLALYIWSPIPLGDSIWEATMYKIQYFAGFVYLVPYTFRWQHLGGYYVQDPIFCWLCVFGPPYLWVTASGRLLCTRSNILLALCIWSPIPLCDSIWEATMYKIQYFAGFVYLVPQTFVWQHLGGYYVQDPIFFWLCVFGPLYLCVTASGRLLCTRSNILLALYIWSPIPLCDSIWEATMYKIQYFAGFVYLVPYTFVWQHLGGYYVQDPIFCWLCVFGPPNLCVTASGRLLCTRSNIFLALCIWSPIPLCDSIWEATMYKIQYFAGFVYLVPYTFVWQHLGGYYVQDPIFY